MDAHNKKENELRQRKFEVGDFIMMKRSCGCCWEVAPIVEVKKLLKNYGYIYRVEHEHWSCDSDLKWHYWIDRKWSGGSGIRGVGEPVRVWCDKCVSWETKMLTLLNNQGDYEYRCSSCGEVIKKNYLEVQKKKEENKKTWTMEHWSGASVTYKERQKIKQEYLEKVN